MTNNLKHEYLQLIQDTRMFTERLLAPFLDSHVKKTPQIAQISQTFSSNLRTVIPDSQASDLLLASKKCEETELKEEIQKKDSLSAVKKSVKNSKWELQPLPQSEEASCFRKQIDPFVATCDLHISTFLILPKEQAEHRLFLENVCRVITKNFASASVVLYHEKLFDSAAGKILLAPVSVLTKKFSSIQPHQICKIATLTLIPLEDLDHYTHDLDCKRTLWKIIQHLFQS